MNAAMTEIRGAYRRLHFFLIAAYVIFSVGTVLAAVWYLASEYRVTLQSARMHSSTLTRALEEHALRTFTALEIQLRNTGRMLLEMRALERPSTPAMVELLRQDKPNIEFVRSLYTYDATGRGHTTTLGADITRLDARNSELFREVMESGSDRAFIGRVLPGPVTKRPSIQIAIGLFGGDGRFAGIIGTAIEPDYFEKFYKDLGDDKGARLVLLRNDGATLTRFPGRHDSPADVSGSEIYRKFKALKATSGTVEGRSMIDGVNLIASFREVRDWNLFVIIALNRDKVLAPWWRIAWMIGSLATGLLAIFTLLLRFALRELARRSESERELRESEQRYKASQSLLSNIIGSAMDAIITVDEGQRILVFNRSAEAMFRCKASDAIGQPLERFIPERFRAEHAARMRTFGATGTTIRAMGRPGAVVGLRANGEEFPVEATIAHAADDGSHLYTVMLRDIVGRVAAAEAQRDALVREVHHRIKNNLQGVIGLIGTHLTAHPELGKLVANMTGQIHAIAMVHGMHSESVQGNIALCEIVSNISRAIMAIARIEITVDLIEGMCNSICIAKDEAVPIALVLNELLNNATKHGLHETAREGVRVKLSADDGVARVRISNPGVLSASGFDFAKGTGLGTGLNLVKALLPRRGASVEIIQVDDQVVVEIALTDPAIIPC